MTDDVIYDQLWHLAGHPSATVNLLALEPSALHRFLAIARMHGVLGIVLSQGGNITSGTGETWDNARLAWNEEIIHSKRVRQHAQVVVEHLKRKRVAAVEFKGPDFVDHLYDDPRLRPTWDVDLLVPRDQWFLAIRELEAMGHKEKPNQPDPFVNMGVLSQRTWVYPMPEEPIEVDLQWSMVHFPYLRRQAAIDYWNLDWQWLPGGEGVLTPAARLVIAAVHAVYHHQFDRLLLLVDLQKACAKVGIDLEQQQRAKIMAERTGAKLALDVALQVTAHFLDDPTVEHLRRALLGDIPPWGHLPEGLFQDARSSMRSLRTSYSTPSARRIRDWLMQQPMKPTPGWEFRPPMQPHPPSPVSGPARMTAATQAAPRTLGSSANAGLWFGPRKTA